MSKFKFIYLIFGIALLVFIFNKVDFNSFLNELNKLRFSFIIILFIYFFGFVFDCYSWKLCIENLINKKLIFTKYLKLELLEKHLIIFFFKLEENL